MNCEAKEVYFEQRGDIGYIVINNAPENMITLSLLEEFSNIVENSIINSKIKGIIITGKGRHFSSGTDIGKLKQTILKTAYIKENNSLVECSEFKRYIDALSSLYSINIPVISAINGLCIGSGFEIALHSHIRICSKGSIVGSPESTFGLMPGLGGISRYVQLCGLGKALELVLSGDLLSVNEALEIGIIDKIVKKNEISDYCNRLMEYILKNEMIYSKSKINSYIKLCD
ncbi:enoyl-CoA hydratase [Clostridium acetobutylicum]|uniref:Enoyl-CoA hydratase n=1 Tax=Clostridium acetobutylicum (strain ATCC 824 / DSM 792 / JCM 1419 / IAM 19013 / LMG 5710 / NBRC 13948 / NRRL B-527 / VKM B-1787 / 2291 / W) TaxID=272562 RepID=Q97HJ9_CLOAB|nr:MULTISPECIES: enoyl-CoA hydratase/isomerase family protein [Clostridium]AAK79971.1 Enoyl-CoA hydratase [Clostridium acetobutylicum ATCC 824]ADZ21064.1 Enoyl-CoA hydratase [Clostridium acetobutylicum EA 2018]AEI34355.1 Enoyl-CoA hydratase [Clostridium acetobutylicum DSM 1731]AWV79598.1 enoyl-CoA hydratase/isomerase family protein [Clostridium acetobutylicum]MBC2394429.1 enoyl-CoA hydratase/isomerase family protein [Clostridium acetobutylicum]